MRCSKENETESGNIYRVKKRKNLLQYTLSEQIAHGMDVSNLVYALSTEVGCREEESYQMAIAGMLHDIGKVVLKDMVDDNNALVVEEIKVVRMHPRQGYEITKGLGYDDLITKSILYHHENYDGSGYPANLRGTQIPLGARLLRICDVYCALTSRRPYRPAYDEQTAFAMMIEQIKDFDLGCFLAFQRVVHRYKREKIEIGQLCIDGKGNIL